MKKKNSRQATLALAMLACMGLAGCGQETETDPAAQGVLEITITPVVTPTPAPAEVDPDAVTTNGDITMVNSYLVDKNSGTASDTGNTDAESTAQTEEEPQADTEGDVQTGGEDTVTEGEDGTSEE